MTCTECNESILFQEEDITVHAVYSDGRIRRVCHHVTSFDETDPTIIAILGSALIWILFLTALEAARAYDTKARELYGEFARLNFPEPGERRAEA